MSLEGTAKTEYASLSGKIHTIVIDKSLSVSGACADAKATGEAINGAEARLANTVEATTEKYLGEKVAPAVEAEVASKAVKNTGDTMTGNFAIKTEAYPSVVLASTRHNTDCTLLNDGNIFRYWIRNKTGDSSNGRELRLFSSTYTAGLKEAIALFDMKDGEGKHYPLLHTGNIGDTILATGSYEGTGSPHSLTFPKEPKLLVITGNVGARDSGGTHIDAAVSLICVPQSGWAVYDTINLQSMDRASSQIVLSGNTVSNIPFSANGVTFHYTAIMC